MSTSTAIDALAAQTGCCTGCTADRVHAIAENDALNIVTGDLPADYVRSVDSFVDEAGDLDCRC